MKDGDGAGSGIISQFNRVCVEDYQERVMAAYDRHLSGKWTSSTFAVSLLMALDIEAGPLSEWIRTMDRFAERAENGTEPDAQGYPPHVEVFPAESA